MTSNSNQHESGSNQPENRRIEQWRQRFEAECRQGLTPKIESYLAEAPAAEWGVLFAVLLRLELYYRTKRGEKIEQHDYRQRFPDQLEVISEVFHAYSADYPLRHHAPTESRGSGAADQPSLLPAGSKIGDYRIVRFLARGAFASVYLAEGVNGEQVAVKVQDSTPEQCEVMKTRFLAEAEVMKKLAGPGVVEIFDAGVLESGVAYIVMEYAAGGSLEDRISNQLVSFREAALWIMKIAEVIHRAHKLGCYHRDLKPANILINAKGELLLADFGLVLEEADQAGVAGEFAGTPYYMAPEQARREPHRMDGRADIWALGVILYQMLVGRHPFRGSSLAAVIDEILHRDPRPPSQLKDSVPHALEDICLKCLAKPIAERYRTANALRQDLHQYLHPVSILSIRSGVAAIVIVLLAAVSIFSLQPSPQSPATPTTPGLVRAFSVDVFLEQRAGSRVRLPEYSGPISNGDGVRIEVDLSENKYVYVAWIDSEGATEIPYPESAGEAPVSSVALPKDPGSTLEVEGRGGTEVAVMLVSDRSLGPLEELKDVLRPLEPFPHLTDGRVIVDGRRVTPSTEIPGLGNNAVVAIRTRGLKLKNAQPLIGSSAEVALERWRQKVEKELPAGVEIRYIAIPHISAGP